MQNINFIKHIRALYNTKLELTNPVHQAVISCLKKFLENLDEDTKNMVLELCISTAKGEWLEEWGKWFGVNRNSAESDAELRVRILNSILVPKNTKQALQIHTRDYFNAKHGYDKYQEGDITIREPFEDINLMSQRGTLSETLRLPDDLYYRWCVVDIIIPESAEDSYKDLIQSIKSAGIRVYYTLRTAVEEFVVDGLSKSEGVWLSSQFYKNLLILRTDIGYKPSQRLGLMNASRYSWREDELSFRHKDRKIKNKQVDWQSSVLTLDDMRLTFDTANLEGLWDYNWDEQSLQHAVQTRFDIKPSLVGLYELGNSLLGDWEDVTPDAVVQLPPTIVDMVGIKE